MQVRVVDGPAVGEIVDAAPLASRALVAVTGHSLGAVADDTTPAQHRVLAVLASRGSRRMVDLAGTLGGTPLTAGRMCDRLARKGLITRHRARVGRREVLVWVTSPGRKVVDDATAPRRGLLTDILSRPPSGQQAGVARALRVFAAAAGEIPDSQRPAGVTGLQHPGEPVRASTGASALPQPPAPQARRARA